jgi:hypothetical protein
LKEYLKPQGRFVHLTDEDVKMLEEEIKDKWQIILALAKALPRRP